jgi:DNA-binding response OmpR family regulator
MTGRLPLILLVDDDRDTREMYGWALELRGFRVVQAATAAAAITLTNAEAPDLVVSDFTLPDGDGFSLAAHVRDTAELAKTPLILLSGHGFTGDAHVRAVALFNRVLLKPVLPDHLVDEIAVLVDGQNAAHP